MYAIINSLSTSELASAKLNTSFDDVLVGPGEDGEFPDSEGLLVSALDSDQQALVVTAINEWVKEMDDDTAASLMETYESELADTYVAWSGSTSDEVAGSYIRIDGPHVWIEFICQNGVVYANQIHFHTIYRDKVADYGGSFSF